MILINGHGAALMPPSQAHAKPNEKGMLSTFVTYRDEEVIKRFSLILANIKTYKHENHELRVNLLYEN